MYVGCIFVSVIISLRGQGEHSLASASQLTDQVTLFKSVNLSVLSFIICKIGLLEGLEESANKAPNLCLAHSRRSKKLSFF